MLKFDSWSISCYLIYWNAFALGSKSIGVLYAAACSDHCKIIFTEQLEHNVFFFSSTSSNVEGDTQLFLALWAASVTVIECNCRISVMVSLHLALNLPGTLCLSHLSVYVLYGTCCLCNSWVNLPTLSLMTSFEHSMIIENKTHSLVYINECSRVLFSWAYCIDCISYMLSYCLEVRTACISVFQIAF